MYGRRSVHLSLRTRLATRRPCRSSRGRLARRGPSVAGSGPGAGSTARTFATPGGIFLRGGARARSGASRPRQPLDRAARIAGCDHQARRSRDRRNGCRVGRQLRFDDDAKRSASAIGVGGSGVARDARPRRAGDRTRRDGARTLDRGPGISRVRAVLRSVARYPGDDVRTSALAALRRDGAAQRTVAATGRFRVDAARTADKFAARARCARAIRCRERTAVRRRGDGSVGRSNVASEPAPVVRHDFRARRRARRCASGSPIRSC